MQKYAAVFAALALLAAPCGAGAQNARAPKGETAGKAAPAKAAVEIDPQTAVAKANDWLNRSDTYTADFEQVAADGRKSEGKLYVQRPGRMRFEYASPATMEIVADGTTISIRDRKLHTQDLYFIKQTPLKFLLKNDIDLARDTTLTGVESNPKSVIISIEDKATFGGTSRIRLVFDPRSFALKQWQVTDPQGYETLVTLHNIDYKAQPDPSLFTVERQ